MRINGFGNDAAWNLSAQQTRRPTTSSASVHSSTGDLVNFSSATQSALSADEGSTYNLHNISHSQLLKVIESGSLSPNGTASGGISISTDWSWKAAPGTSFSSTLFTVAQPPCANGAASDAAEIPGSMDLFKTVQNQMIFDQSLGDTQSAAGYQSLLNTLEAATDKNGNLLNK